VTIHDFGRVDGRAFIVMEYVAGETLDRFVRRRTRLSLADFVPIAAQVLKGLGEAHSRGIIHRDIKPANIMLCERQGRANYVKILDFGLAKLVSGSSDITKQNVLGTPTCLSPEQILGEKIDQRVDVYAVGTLFYFMLAGVMPFTAENDTALLYKHVHEKPQPLVGTAARADHGVPDGVLELIGRCLEKSRDKRPRDANEVVEGLIDQVPFSMFRLPRAQPRTEEPAEQAEEGKRPDRRDARSRSRGPRDPGRQLRPRAGAAGVPGAADPAVRAVPLPMARPMTIPPAAAAQRCSRVGRWPISSRPRASRSTPRRCSRPRTGARWWSSAASRTRPSASATCSTAVWRRRGVVVLLYAMSGRGDDEAQADPTAAPIASARTRSRARRTSRSSSAVAEDLINAGKFSKAKLTLDAWEDSFKRIRS
jgi:serine/threonine protein kinase